MPQTDDALKVLAETLQKAVQAINMLIDAKNSDHGALEEAKTKIADLEKASSEMDANTASSVSALTASLNQLAEKALSATVQEGSDAETLEPPQE